METDRSNQITEQREFPDHADFTDNVFTPQQKNIMGYLYRTTGSWETAKDLTQETFLRAYRNIERVRASGRPLNLKAWLYTIASNLAINHGTRNNTLQTKSFDKLEASEKFSAPAFRVASRYELPEDYALLAEKQSAVHVALSKIPPHYRDALIALEEGLSCEEIGRNIGRTRSATKSILHRARQALKAELQDA